MSVSVSIDPGDPTPPFEQLRRQLATLITSGTLAEGRRLTPVRQLAADLGLAAGTVARTYRALEADGLVRTARGAGTRVAAGAHRLSAGDRALRLADRAREYVDAARQLGADEEAITRAIDEALRPRERETVEA